MRGTRTRQRLLGADGGEGRLDLTSLKKEKVVAHGTFPVTCRYIGQPHYEFDDQTVLFAQQADAADFAYASEEQNESDLPRSSQRL